MSDLIKQTRCACDTGKAVNDIRCMPDYDEDNDIKNCPNCSHVMIKSTDDFGNLIYKCHNCGTFIYL